MQRPDMTKDQKEMAIALLANAIRKDAHLRARARDAQGPGAFLHTGMSNRRVELAQRYIEGMRDMLRMLFPNGHAVAEACMEEAYALAMGTAAPVESTGDGTNYH